MSAHHADWHDKDVRHPSLELVAHAPNRFQLLGLIDRRALRDVIPVLVGIAPFAVVIGVSLSRLEIAHWSAVAASALMYGGSAQLAATNLILSGADIVTILIAVAVVNARLLMYGAALEPRFRDQPRWFRWLAPHFITDPTYALATNRPELARDPARFRRYWLTISGAIGALWLGAIGISLVGGARIHPESALMIAAPVSFIGMLVPQVVNRRTLAIVLGASIVASAGAVLPNGMGLLAGILTGMVVGCAVDRIQA